MLSLFIENALERVPGIEPGLSAWQADALPLHHTRDYKAFRNIFKDL